MWAGAYWKQKANAQLKTQRNVCLWMDTRLLEMQSLCIVVLKFPKEYVNFCVMYGYQTLKKPPCSLNSLDLKNNVYHAISLDTQLVLNYTGLWLHEVKQEVKLYSLPF